MKKKYISPRQKVVTIDAQERLLADSNIDAGGYGDTGSKPGDDGDDMDEDAVKGVRLWDNQW